MIAISAYTAAVMTTTIADVMVIYATLPFVAPGSAFSINRERVSRAHARSPGAWRSSASSIMVGAALARAACSARRCRC